MLVAVIIGLAGCAATPKPEWLLAGELVTLENLTSAYVPDRMVQVWLPPGYPAEAPYDVVYMNDGQNLFDPTNTWNNQEWRVDETATALMTTEQTYPFIVVAISHGGERRHSEYFPQKAFERLSSDDQNAILALERAPGIPLFTDSIQSDNYLKFIVEELKPRIDRDYAVAITPTHTHMIGASMGGLISLYALSEYPDVFGNVACLSTHWPGTPLRENNPVPEALLAYFEQYLPEPDAHKIYFDHGDQGLDAAYPLLQKRVDALMIRRGYNESSWTTQVFEGADHSEQAWADRLRIPLRFLMAVTP